MKMDYLETKAKKIRKDLRKDWDALIIIDGKERSGKSTLMLKLARLIDPDFKLTNIVYRHGNLVDKIYSLPPYSVVVHDELGLDAFTRDAMSRTNKELVKAMMVCGDQNKCLIACMPNYWWLDTYLRDHRTSLWIRVTSVEYMGNRIRGFAKFRTPMENEWGGTPFFKLDHIYKFEHMEEKVYQKYKEQKQRIIRAAMVEDEPEDSTDSILRRMDELKIPRKTQAAIMGKHPSNITRKHQELEKLRDCAPLNILYNEKEVKTDETRKQSSKNESNAIESIFE